MKTKRLFRLSSYWTIFFLLVLPFLLCGRLHAGESVLFRFVDETGRPVADVEIVVSIHAVPRQFTLTADQNGCCVLDFSERQIKNRIFDVYTFHPDFVNQYCRFGGKTGIRSRPDEKRDDVKESCDAQKTLLPSQYVFRLERGQALGGTVFDTEGKPVENAVVEIGYANIEQGREDWPRYNPPKDKSVSDADGKWIAARIVAGRKISLRLSFRAPGRAPKAVIEESEEAIRRLQEMTYQTTLSPGTRISGKLVADENTDFEKTRLMLCGPFHYDTKIDVSKEGAFHVDGLEPRIYRLQIVPTNHRPVLMERKLNAGENRVEIPLESGHPIRFRAVDLKGRPLSGVVVQDGFLKRGVHLPGPLGGFQDLTQAIKPTDIEGRTSWSNALNEPAFYEFHHEDHLETRTPCLVPGDAEHTVVMCPKMTVKGKVTDAETGRPIPIFFVRALLRMKSEFQGQTHEAWGHYGYHRTLFDEGNGQYEVAPSLYMHESPCRIEISADGYQTAVSREFSLIGGNQTFDFELKKASPDEEY